MIQSGRLSFRSCVDISEILNESDFAKKMSTDVKFVIAGIAVEIAVLVLFVQKRLWRRYTLFTTYLCWSVISDLVFAVTPGFYASNLRNYIFEIAIDSLLQLTVLLELTWSVVKPVKASLPKISLVFVPFLLVVLTLICWPLAGFVVPTGLSRHGYELVMLQQTTSLLRVVFLLVLVAFSQFLSIGWRDRELQIASGLGFYSILSLIVWVLHTHQAVGPQYHWLDLVTSFGYLGTLTYWVVSFAQKEPEVRKISPQMMRFLVSIGGSLQADRLALETAVKKKPGKYTHR